MDRTRTLDQLLWCSGVLIFISMMATAFLIPNSWQVFVETVYDFPYISMIFVFILFNNLMGLFFYSFSKPQVARYMPLLFGRQDPGY